MGSRGWSASAGGLVAALLGDKLQTQPADKRRSGHLCVARRAMACDFSVYLPANDRNALPAAEAALAEIEAMDELLSAYQGSSAVCYLNENAAGVPVRVDDRLFRLLQRAAAITQETAGAFDASAGRLIKAWGFFARQPRVPGEAERLAALACTGMQHVELDEAERTVRYRAAGLEINLGSIGKGYAIDRAMRRMREEFGIRDALMQGGLSSVCAMGSPAGSGHGWLVGIQNPCDHRQRVATVRLKDRALGTSGDANQHFESGGRRYGHVLDPRTGWPASGLASASVLAPDAATADALSTALLVMGLDKAAVFCQDHPGIAALLVLAPGPGRGTADSPQVRTFNLAPQDVDLMPPQRSGTRMLTQGRERPRPRRSEVS